MPLPSVDELVGLYGKRVLLMSGSDYGHEMDWLAFNHRSPCNFSEPQFRWACAQSHANLLLCDHHCWVRPLAHQGAPKFAWLSQAMHIVQ